MSLVRDIRLERVNNACEKFIQLLAVSTSIYNGMDVIITQKKKYDYTNTLTLHPID